MKGLILPKAKTRRNSIHLIYAIALGTIMLIGVFSGAVLINSNIKIENKYLVFFIDSFLQSHKNTEFSTLMSFSFLSGMLVHILTLLLGFSCIGAPLVALIPFVRGVFIGCISGYLYSDMGARGILMNAMLFWLPQVMQGIALLIFASYALNISMQLFTSCFKEQQQGIRTALKQCVNVFIFTSLILFITAVFESLLSQVLAGVLIR